MHGNCSKVVTSWLAVLLVLPALVAGEGNTKYPMRWRVMCDRDQGVTLRFPYGYHIPNQYHRGLSRGGGGARLSQGEIAQIRELDEEELRAFMERRQVTSGFDVEVFCATGEDVPTGADLDAQAEALCEHGGFTWSDYDYYAGPERRPHRDPEWAPEGIVGRIGEVGEHCALALRVPGREQLVVVLATGGLDAHDNRRIFDSLEVMAERRGEYRSWRSDAGGSGKVITADGQAVSARRLGRAQGASWKGAWEVETPNYHITTNASPQHALLFGRQMDALYDAYVGIYQPERVPPYKLEVHIFKDQADFVRGAGANGIGPIPPTALGFFTPTQLSIFAYQRHDLFGTLAHEASHQFLHVTCNGSSHVPTWINEGLAVYFESSTFERGRLVWHPPKQRLGYLKMVYGQQKRPLADLDYYINHYGHIAAMQYGEVYAMTHYWIFGSKKGREKFHQYWLALKEGQNGTKAFERIFMDDLMKMRKFGGDRDKVVAAFSQILVKYVMGRHAERLGHER